jgi:hypothetical protein
MRASVRRMPSVPPEALKPTRRQRCIAGRILYVAVPEGGLQRPGVDPVHVGAPADARLKLAYSKDDLERAKQRCLSNRRRDSTQGAKRS